jgi:hypothetical protein
MIKNEDIILFPEEEEQGEDIVGSTTIMNGEHNHDHDDEMNNANSTSNGLSSTTGSRISSSNGNSNHEELAASFQGMGLMGGTAPAPPTMEHPRHTTTATNNNSHDVAPPPAAAPPLPPPDSPQKQQNSGSNNNNSQQAYLSVDALLDAGPAGPSGNQAQQQRQRQTSASLLDRLTGSLLMSNNAGAGDGGLFGDMSPSREDDGDLFGGPGSDDDDDGLFQSSVHNHQHEEDEQSGTLISDAPAPARPTHTHHPPAPAVAPPAALAPSVRAAPPPDASFYRNHAHAAGAGAFPQYPSASNQSIGTASTLSVNTLGGAQLPIKGQQQHNMNGNGNQNKNNNTTTTKATKRKPRKPFVIPDYIVKFKPTFNSVAVGDPRQISGGGVSLLLASVTSGSSKFWVYTVSSTTSRDNSNKTTHVQRRFRHFDALQDRLRQACPGAILPSR